MMVQFGISKIEERKLERKEESKKWVEWLYLVFLNAFSKLIF